MIRIYKYELPKVDRPTIETYDGAKVLSAHAQGDALCVWLEVNTRLPVVRRTFAISGTGHNIGDLPNTALFVGTTFFYDATLVLHVYDLGEAAP